MEGIEGERLLDLKYSIIGSSIASNQPHNLNKLLHTWHDIDVLNLEQNLLHQGINSNSLDTVRALMDFYLEKEGEKPEAYRRLKRNIEVAIDEASWPASKEMIDLLEFYANKGNNNKDGSQDEEDCTDRESESDDEEDVFEPDESLDVFVVSRSNQKLVSVE
eukprot:TRINITY_DN12988_c0_g2_i1.p1 TRINITY_DN12988_c0_g2~~TRINITY_DN12988_c0_g2_i1.p1  ORF type:complete len:162 (-),score=37.93 TRINITY_DN12988_c0_g2_i1:65-550(-)